MSTFQYVPIALAGLVDVLRSLRRDLLENHGIFMGKHWLLTTLSTSFNNVGKTRINYPFRNGLHHPFMVIWGMVCYCFTNITNNKTDLCWPTAEVCKKAWSYAHLLYLSEDLYTYWPFLRILGMITHVPSCMMHRNTEIGADTEWRFEERQMWNMSKKSSPSCETDENH